MQKETLKTLRLVVPGFIAIVVLVFLVSPFQQQVIDTFERSPLLKAIAGEGIIYILILAVVLTLGSLYYAFDLRSVFLRGPLQQVQDNIKNQLLLPFQADESIAKASNRLRQDRSLMHIFYHFIDND